MQAPALASVIEEYRYVVEDRDFPTIRAWRAETGGKVVGCFPVYTPLELIDAHGMLAPGVIGGGNQIELAHADSRFQSFVCSIIKSTLELGMTDRLDCFEGLVFSSICDPARNLASIYKRNFPKLQIEFLHLPQNPGSAAASDYLVSEYTRLMASFATLAERTASEADLEASIARYNRVRRLLRELYELRAQTPERVSATDSYVLTRVSTLLAPDASAALLERALAEFRASNVKPKDRVRVVLVGAFCEQPPIDLIESLEQAGCYVLDDDFLLGWRFFTDDVPLDGQPPLRALAETYLNRSVHASVKHDPRQRRASSLIQRVKELQADAVIFLGAKFCEPALFDYALYRRALEEHGIRHLMLEFEEKMWLYDRVRSEVETFVESMLFD